jgi:hypothetical protein
MTTQTEFEKAIWADRKLTTAQKIIGLCLARYADWATGEHSHPGNKLIAEECGMTERTVERNTPALLDQGWLIQTYRGQGRNSSYANEYRLSLPDMMSVTHDVQTDIVSSQTDIVSSSNRHHVGTPSHSPSHLPSLLEENQKRTGGEKKKRRRAITENDLGLSSVPPSSSAPSVDPGDMASSVPESADRTYVLWESRDVPGKWFVFPVGKALRAPKSAGKVTLSAEEDEFYREFFRGGKELNRSRAEFLTGSPEERARNIEYIRDRPGLHPMTDDEYSRAA